MWMSWRYSVRHQPAAAEPVLVDLGRTVALIFLFVLIVRSFIIEPYKIPSESMVPTLQKGDYIVVSKYSYGLRLPVSHTRLLHTGEPRRGEVVVFRKPGAEKITYVKRVIGVSGDRLSYKNRQLQINGVPVILRFLPLDDRQPDDRLEYGVETIGELEHKIVHHKYPAAGTIQWFEETVPENHIFVMGDNRDDSQDSRYQDLGFIPLDNLVGKASRVWFNSSDWGRVGSRIQ